jgi:hypothetical protein
MAKAMVAFLLLAGLGCVPEVPSKPTFSRDVKPIFMARCVRCHDETLREETLPDGGHGLGVPSQCHLNRYESTGDCTPAGVQAMACSYGAGLCAPSILIYSISVGGSKPFMPPLPAPALDDWEQDVISGWMKNLDASGMPAP